MSYIPNINDMLKLYTKKELWDRLQHHVKKIDDLQHQLDHQKEMWNKLKEWLEYKSNAMNKEMPKSCADCENCTKHQLLHDHDKELVEKVLERTKSLITKYDLIKDYTGCAGYFMLNKIIEQIQEEQNYNK